MQRVLEVLVESSTPWVDRAILILDVRNHSRGGSRCGRSNELVIDGLAYVSVNDLGLLRSVKLLHSD